MDVSPAVAPWRELFGHQGADGVLVACDVTLRVGREGTCDKCLGPSPNPTSTKGGDIRHSKGFVLTSTVF